MKSKLLAGTAVAAFSGLMCVISTPAAAQPEDGSGVYVAADAGYNFHDTVGVIPYAPPNVALNGKNGSAIKTPTRRLTRLPRPLASSA